MSDAEPIKDDCKFCDLVLIGTGLVLAGILTFMAVDLLTDGRLSGGITRATGRLASVTELRPHDGDADAG